LALSQDNVRLLVGSKASLRDVQRKSSRSDATEAILTIAISHGSPLLALLVGERYGLALRSAIELEEHDLVAVRGTDELRAGTLVATKQAQQAPSPR